MAWAASASRNFAVRESGPVASIEESVSKTGLKSGEGTAGSMMRRIVNTASRAVTGEPSSQTAPARSVSRTSRPSGETS